MPNRIFSFSILYYTDLGHSRATHSQEWCHSIPDSINTHDFSKKFMFSGPNPTVKSCASGQSHSSVSKTEESKHIFLLYPTYTQCLEPKSPDIQHQNKL